MGGFRRALLGYRRAEVDAAVAARELQVDRLEKELGGLAAMMVGRQHEMESLREALAGANARHERSLASLESVADRLDEIHAQARRQATRIRMNALREAVEIDRRANEVSERIESESASSNGAGNGRSAAELFEGIVEVEIGPLGDFSQLVGFEDAAGRIGATSEISVRKFSEGRATLSMRLDEPVELLRELEQRSPLEFRVRKTGGGKVVLDLDDEAAEAA